MKAKSRNKLQFYMFHFVFNKIYKTHKKNKIDNITQTHEISISFSGSNSRLKRNIVCVRVLCMCIQYARDMCAKRLMSAEKRASIAKIDMRKIERECFCIVVYHFQTNIFLVYFWRII